MVSEREEENIILRKTQAKKSPPQCCAELPERLQGPAPQVGNKFPSRFGYKCSPGAFA